MGDQIWVKIEDIDMTNPYDERYVLTINIYMYNRYIGEIFFEDNEEDMYLLYYRFENFYKFGFCYSYLNTIKFGGFIINCEINIFTILDLYLEMKECIRQYEIVKEFNKVHI